MKGATACYLPVPNQAPISIHAPVKGATPVLYFIGMMLKHFNPRSREGSDPLANERAAIYVISIHAPVKGATVENMHFMHKHTLIMYISILI